MIKPKDIEILSDDGEFQMVIYGACVTRSSYKTAEACYRAYIVELTKKLAGIEKILSS